jgi:UDP:flavonoid glycosyltransferase YjiC (YdhE family)
LCCPRIIKANASSGWSELNNAASNEILHLKAVPHQWLLPRCQMVIHHGRAGTTSAGLHAGIPNIVIPFTADQPFWATRVHAIVAGPKPVPVKRLSIEYLTCAIVEAANPVLRKRARNIGQELRRLIDDHAHVKELNAIFKVNCLITLDKDTKMHIITIRQYILARSRPLTDH